MSARIAIPLVLTPLVVMTACGGTATNIEDERDCGAVVRDYEDLYGRRYGDQTHTDFDAILTRAETHRSDAAPSCLTLQGITDSIRGSRAPRRAPRADPLAQQYKNKSLGFGAIVLFAFAGLLMLASFGASIMLLIIAFQESLVWGLLYLFVPFASLVFVVMYWDKAGRPFLVSLGTGLAAAVLMTLAVV